MSLRSSVQSVNSAISAALCPECRGWTTYKSLYRQLSDDKTSAQRGHFNVRSASVFGHESWRSRGIVRRGFNSRSA